MWQLFGRENRAWWLVLATLLGCLVLYIQFIFPNIAGFYTDAGYYLQGAQALAQGLGYIRFNDSDHPAITVYPPLVSLCFSMIWHFWPNFPENLPWFKSLEFCWLLASGGCLYYYCTRIRKLPQWLSCLFLLVIVLDYQLFGFAISLLSEPLYLLLSLLCLIWFEQRLAFNKPSWKALLGMALLCGALYYTRTIGLAMTAAAGMVLWQRHGWKTAASFWGMTIPLCLPWTLWYTHQTLGIYPVSPETTFVAFNAPYPLLTQYKLTQFGGMLPVWGLNLVILARILAQTWLKGLDFFSAQPGVLTASLTLSTLLCLSLLANGLSHLRQKWSLPAWYLFFYMLGILSWFTNLVLYRFLLVILPLLWIFAYDILQKLFRQRSGLARAVISVLLLFTLYGNGLKWGEWLTYPDKTQFWFQYEPSTSKQMLMWGEFNALFDYIKNHTAPTDRIYTLNEMVISLYTGRPAEYHFAFPNHTQPITWKPSPKDIEALFRQRQVRYALIQEPHVYILDDPYLLQNRLMPLPRRPELYADRLRKARPDLFEDAYISPHGNLHLVRFKG